MRLHVSFSTWSGYIWVTSDILPCRRNLKWSEYRALITIIGYISHYLRRFLVAFNWPFFLNRTRINVFPKLQLCNSLSVIIGICVALNCVGLCKLTGTYPSRDQDPDWWKRPRGEFLCRADRHYLNEILWFFTPQDPQSVDGRSACIYVKIVPNQAAQNEMHCHYCETKNTLFGLCVFSVFCALLLSLKTGREKLTSIKH